MREKLEKLLDTMIEVVDSTSDQSIKNMKSTLEHYKTCKNDILKLYLNDFMNKSQFDRDDMILDDFIMNTDIAEDGTIGLELLEESPKPMMHLFSYLPQFDFTTEGFKYLEEEINNLILKYVGNIYKSKNQVDESIETMFFGLLLSNINNFLEVISFNDVSFIIEIDEKSTNLISYFAEVVNDHKVFEKLDEYKITIESECLNNIEEETLESSPLSSLIESDDFNVDTLLGNEKLFRKDGT